MKKSNIEPIIKELELVLEYYRLPTADFCWSSYDSAKEAIADIEQTIEDLKNEDTSVFGHIKFLFAPTADSQEIAMSSGWADEYIKSSTRIDRYLG